MIVTAYSFFDSKVGIFHPPFFMLHRGQAFRAALELASDMSTQIGRHPADFVLFELGQFNDQTGALETVAPINLGVVQSFLPVQPGTPSLFSNPSPSED